jgi:hypothetical protein
MIRSRLQKGHMYSILQHFTLFSLAIHRAAGNNPTVLFAPGKRLIGIGFRPIARQTVRSHRMASSAEVKDDKRLGATRVGPEVNMAAAGRIVRHKETLIASAFRRKMKANIAECLAPADARTEYAKVSFVDGPGKSDLLGVMGLENVGIDGVAATP